MTKAHIERLLIYSKVHLRNTESNPLILLRGLELSFTGNPIPYRHRGRETDGGWRSGAQVLKRIPRIKFPQRHPKPTGLTSQSKDASRAANSNLSFFSSSKVTASVGGKASLQPKRTSVSNDEIEAILLSGCI